MPSRSPERIEKGDVSKVRIYHSGNSTQLLFFHFTVQPRWHSSGLQGIVEAAGAFPKGPHGREAQGQLLMRNTWMLMLVVMLHSPSIVRHHLVSLVSIARHVRDKWLGNGWKREESLSEIAVRNPKSWAMK